MLINLLCQIKFYCWLYSDSVHENNCLCFIFIVLKHTYILYLSSLFDFEKVKRTRTKILSLSYESGTQNKITSINGHWAKNNEIINIGGHLNKWLSHHHQYAKKKRERQKNFRRLKDDDHLYYLAYMKILRVRALKDLNLFSLQHITNGSCWFWLLYYFNINIFCCLIFWYRIEWKRFW